MCPRSRQYRPNHSLRPIADETVACRYPRRDCRCWHRGIGCRHDPGRSRGASHIVRSCIRSWGKAKSLRLADGHPTEHSLRVYTDTYQTLLTLFSRIPTEHDRTVLDNLVGVSMVSATAQGVIGRIAAPVALQRRRPTFARIIGKVVEPPRQLVRILLRGPMVIVGLAQRGVPATDVLHYLYAHLRLLWMCRERLLAELGDISYADYLQLGCKSAQAQEFFFCCAAHLRRGAHQCRSGGHCAHRSQGAVSPEK